MILVLEGGVDPAEHGAKMEDRFYNNKAFTVSTERFLTFISLSKTPLHLANLCV